MQVASSGKPKSRMRQSRAQDWFYKAESFTVEELPDDDLGYFGDVEVIRPDQLEEVDSGSEGGGTERLTDDEYWHSKLAERLEDLNCDSDTNTSRDNPDRTSSRKRRSRQRSKGDQHEHASRDNSADHEDMEVCPSPDAVHRTKRRRQKTRRSRTSERVIDRLPDVQIELIEPTAAMSPAVTSLEATVSTPSSNETPLEDLMDVD